MKWINYKDQPPTKGALVRHKHSKVVLDNTTFTTDSNGEEIVRQDWDEYSEEYLVEMIEWLDESPEKELGASEKQLREIWNNYD